ncbi:MAG: hypothetical protein ACTSYO_05215 [Candidatus Ranarchaeia archaeon]
MTWARWADSLRKSTIRHLKLRKAMLEDQIRILKEEITQLKTENEKLRRVQRKKHNMGKPINIEFHC